MGRGYDQKVPLVCSTTILIMPSALQARPVDAGGFHKTVEYKQTSRHTVFESVILHTIEMSLRLIRCKIGSNCEMLVP